MGLALTVGCTKDNPKDPDPVVPDPVGTITANISESTSISMNTYYGAVKWTKPDNLYLYGNYCRVSICNLGKVKGLGNIANKLNNVGSLPQTGWTILAYSNYEVACETGHGYVIKYSYSDEIVGALALYVVEPIISTSGGIMGAKVKYISHEFKELFSR